MAKLIVISWRDVPAQVLVKLGRETAKVQLSHRFQEAVDRAAMRVVQIAVDRRLEGRSSWLKVAREKAALKAEAAR